YHVMGCDFTVMMCGQAGQLELNVMMPMISHNLNEMMIVMIGAVRAFTDKLVKGLILNQEQAERWLAKNPILVTALNPIIGYNNGAMVAKKALAENKSVREVVLELGLMKEEDLDKALDAYEMTKGGLQGIAAGG
ncbi:MAG: aspartate ammonia-lyase, partial [Anaerolineae bacterium]|nr:aspartate ammonia-lyase [Anaerolineae bacterium]